MALPNIFALKNPIKDYAWGDSRRLSELFGIENPEGEPQAEIWMGAHPGGPSCVETEDGERSLDELIAAEPQHFIGADTAARFEGRLPFLFKVLNAGEPLSIQLHPDKKSAEVGFAAEESRGVPRSEPTRNYADPNHKPELICALTPFRALCGFRPYDDACDILAILALPQLAAPLARLQEERNKEAMQALCLHLLQMPQGDVDDMLGNVLAQAATLDRPDLNELCLLHEYYPQDRGVMFALLLNRVELLPGEALFLSAGNVHSYLGGVGLEIMANSDNVIRGGLTPKHVDCDELMKLADFRVLAQHKIRVAPEQQGALTVYKTPVDDFDFALVNVDDAPASFEQVSAEILFCISGAVQAVSGEERVEMGPGESCMVCAASGGYLLEGKGQLARAAVRIP